MRGKKRKELSRIAKRMHLRLLVDGKMQKPENIGEAAHQLKWITKKLKRNWNALSEPQKSALHGSTQNLTDSVSSDEKSTEHSTEPVVL